MNVDFTLGGDLGLYQPNAKVSAQYYDCAFQLHGEPTERPQGGPCAPKDSATSFSLDRRLMKGFCGFKNAIEVVCGLRVRSG